MIYSLGTEVNKIKGEEMEKTRVTKLTDKDIGRFFVSGKRSIVITDSFQSLYLSEDMETGEEFTFYNTGECTSIMCGWLWRDVNKIRKAKKEIEMSLGVPARMIGGSSEQHETDSK